MLKNFGLRVERFHGSRMHFSSGVCADKKKPNCQRRFNNAHADSRVDPDRLAQDSTRSIAAIGPLNTLIKSAADWLPKKATGLGQDGCQTAGTALIMFPMSAAAWQICIEGDSCIHSVGTVSSGAKRSPTSKGISEDGSDKYRSDQNRV